MRVAGSTRDKQTDAVLDKAARLARQEVSKRRPTNLEEECSASSAAYRGIERTWRLVATIRKSKISVR